MKLQAEPTKSGLTSLGLLPPLFLMFAAGGLLAVGVQRSTVLRADTSNDQDQDHDGLVDAQEWVLSTSPTNADTDGDGYSDLEELARQTSPTAPQVHPDNNIDNSLGIGMSCHWANNKVHALIAWYLPDGRINDKTLRVGMMIGQHISLIPEQALLHRARVETYDGRAPGSRIVTLDFPFSPSLVHSFGGVTVFAATGYKGHGAIAADVAHLIDVGGVVVFCRVDHTQVMGMSSVTNGHQHPSGSGLIYVPLGTDDGPYNWTPGSVCQQQTQIVGTSGVSVTEEVVSAECADGWDSACPPGCPDTVGSTYTTVDPVLLIGG